MYGVTVPAAILDFIQTGTDWAWTKPILASGYATAGSEKGRFIFGGLLARTGQFFTRDFYLC